jgi:hypothetical protein
VEDLKTSTNPEDNPDETINGGHQGWAICQL